ncbi:acetyl-CoA carboxylase biotin carboxylase subunit [candidate division WOR-3 bacterium]|uniref:Biotin carboxylase n=1 Tax=candidate division WOR-3 bacterium TaxID=2052148 RepID=A0A660SL47_UNCW3|nr:MAG: acetyl-CoA carboxylase biotin carboxylase subunit [candidate division WOR-3 bacterium]
MLKKILVANRGEIALRIIRAAKEVGIETVAIYSEADENSLHVRFADEAICIGPPPASESYLKPSTIIAAAEVSGVDAIHPGYGFLAEDPSFAEICESHQLIFLGPTSEQIRKMGDKVLAKKTAHDAGVPTIPGSDHPIESITEARRICAEIGYPVMLKAAAGGGGRGMRIVRNENELLATYPLARAEAQSAFGDDRIYIEKLITQARHIEVQILGDGQGGVVHLGERECSIQRRHQKLIEESPSPVVDSELRKKICSAAVRLARAINYRSAGTVEFLLDSDKNFYFMEMNTRIQVEHPVTEMVTGVDIVKEQFHIANNHGLSLRQKDIRLTGSALECRINAEDPDRGFIPTPGLVKFVHLPGGLGVRVDTHIYGGYQIPPHYDSLIAKLIVHDQTRDRTIRKMRRALEEMVIDGIATTIPFHQDLLTDEDFCRGRFSTEFLKEKFSQ